MNSSVLAIHGGFVAQSLREPRGNRLGVVAALFTMLLFLAGCGGNTKTATPTPAFTPGAGSYSATQNVTVSDTNQNAVLYCTNDGSTPTASSPKCANPIKVSQSQTLSAIAIAPGMAPSAVASAAYAITGSVAAPTVTGIGPAMGSSSGDTHVTVVGTNFTGVTAVNFGTTQAASFTVNSSTSITAVSPPGAGSVHITVIAAGGTSATTTADVFSYGAAPSITGLSPASATVGSAGITLAVSGGNFTSDAIVKWNGASLTTAYVGSTQLTAAVPASLLAAAGTATVTVTQSGGASTGVAFAINAAAPSIVGISPSQGVSAGGTQVNITGTNFTGVSAVKFGAASAASFTVISSNSISAVSPAGSAGMVDIQVVTPSGASATGISDQFTYLAPPAVTSVSPASGSIAGGTTVAISGMNLTGATSVSFGTTAAAGFTFNSSTGIISAVSPPGSVGTVDIRIVTSGGTSAISGADHFTFTTAPVVTSVNPSAGPLAGGTAVTIQGENFSGATAVKFNSTPGNIVSVSADGSNLSATSPAGSAGTVDITVVTPAGASATSSADQFIYAPAPTVSSVQPATGSTGGGTVVTITGTNFTGTGYTVTAVNFGGVPATFSVSADGLSISATSPAGSAGSVGVTVVTPGGSGVSATQFTYAPPPVVQSISPSYGPATGNTPVTIRGTGFSGATEVDFGSTAVTPASVSADGTSITATTPAASSVGAVDVKVVTPIGTDTLTGGFTYELIISGTVKDGGTPISGSTVTLYAAGISGYGSTPTVIATAANPTDSTGAFTIPLTASDCPAAPGDLFYLVATGGNAGAGTNTQIALMAALGSCKSSAFPTAVTVNEATTVASTYALAGFANVDTAANGVIIDVGAPATLDSTLAPKCDENHGWQSTGASTCNYIGLKNAFAVVDNLVNLPTGQALAVTPAYCTTKPCIDATATTPYYNTSIVPQGRINALANALAACVDTQSSESSPSTKCSTLFTATGITTASTVVTVPSGTTVTPADTLQAVLNIAHCPGDITLTSSCGVDVESPNGIYSLVAATPSYTPTLTLTTATLTGIATDLSLAVVYQGGGLGGGLGTAGSPKATGLAIDGSGNVWVPSTSSAGGSLAVFNNLGAPITTSGTSDSAYGGYTTGVHNPQSIAIDPTSGTGGNPWIAWVASSPAGSSTNGSLTQIQLNSTTLALSTPASLSGLTSTALLKPVPYGVAVDSNGNPWISSNAVGINGYRPCGSTYGGSILEFDKGTGSVLNPGTNGAPDGYLSYADNNSCPTAIAFDGSGYLWTSSYGINSVSNRGHYGLLQLNTPTSSGTPGTVAGGPYSAGMQYLSNVNYFNDQPFNAWNLVIDGSGNSWFLDGVFMDVIPNLTQAGASALSAGTWGASLATASNTGSTEPRSAVTIDGGGNAWAIGFGGLWGYSSANASLDFATYSGDAVMLSPQAGSDSNFKPAGYQPLDPTANASGRTGGTYPLVPDAGDTQSSLGVDSSGNLWVSAPASDYLSTAEQGSQLTEFVGMSTPVVAPLTPSSLGTRP